MELTVLAVSSVFLVGVGYAAVQKAQQSPLVAWTLVCASLFALSTRDLFQSRERGFPDSESTDGRTADGRTAADSQTDPSPRTAASRPPARADGGEDPSQ